MTHMNSGRDSSESSSSSPFLEENLSFQFRSSNSSLKSRDLSLLDLGSESYLSAEASKMKATCLADIEHSVL